MRAATVFISTFHIGETTAQRGKATLSMLHIQICLTLEYLLMYFVAFFILDLEGSEEVICKYNETGYLYEIMFTSKGVVELASRSMEA